jgi:hypothetical protein
MFGKTPIKPILDHMSIVTQCASVLSQFFEAAYAEDWEKAAHFQQEISKLEHDADVVKRDFSAHLPSNLFMPVSRTDILELVFVQDRVANVVKDIAGLVFGRKMKIPEPVQSDFMMLLKRTIDAVLQANKAINELNDVVEAGFGGKELAITDKMVHELLKIESETDKIQVQLRKSVFEMEATLHPVSIIFLYKTIEWTGKIADRAQHIGNRLLILLAR